MLKPITMIAVTRKTEIMDENGFDLDFLTLIICYFPLCADVSLRLVEYPVITHTLKKFLTCFNCSANLVDGEKRENAQNQVV